MTNITHAAIRIVARAYRIEAIAAETQVHHLQRLRRESAHLHTVNDTTESNTRPEVYQAIREELWLIKCMARAEAMLEETRVER